jgi:hypothetical protein
MPGYYKYIYNHTLTLYNVQNLTMNEADSNAVIEFYINEGL